MNVLHSTRLLKLINLLVGEDEGRLKHRATNSLGTSK